MAEKRMVEREAMAERGAMAEVADGGVEAEVAHVGALAEASPSRGELLGEKLACGRWGHRPHAA